MIVFPMAGLSRRFAEAGYDVPKYRLEAHGRSLFAHAVGGFAEAFAGETFLFVMLDRGDGGAFVRGELAGFGIGDAEVVLLDRPTRGQAETVAFGLERCRRPDAGRLTIFNIDTFRPAFRQPREFDRHAVDGYLEVFRGSGSNWSFVRPFPGTDRVQETTEKVPISDLCCTGLYEFATREMFLDLYHASSRLAESELQGGELYVAPLYNGLIRDGADIRYRVIERDEVIFCGVPQEYEAFKAGEAPVAQA